MRHSFHPYGPDAPVFDLGSGFDDPRISDEGVLELAPNAQHAIHLFLGATALEMVRITFPGDTLADQSANPLTRGPRNAYVIRVLGRSEGEGVLIDDELVPATDSSGAPGSDEWRMGKELIIGRQTTPELHLPTTVGRRHLSIRLGAPAGNIHLQDLNSTNGTLVGLHPEDVGLILPPRKLIRPSKNGMVMWTEENQRWQRPE